MPPVPDLGIGPGTDPGTSPDPGSNLDQGSFPDFSVPDTYIETNGSIGSACLLDGHCLDNGVCLSWPGGYCTLLGCLEDSELCPEDTQCISTGGNSACLKKCESSEDCRQDKEHACKTLEGANLGLSKVCMGTQAGASPLAGICSADDNCSGEAACYGGVPGGMCVVNGCGLNTCPEGSQCVALDGLPRCLKECSSNSDCPGGSELGRSCESMKKLNGESFDACFVPQGDSPIGAPCTGGYGCASGSCRIVATGVCSNSTTIACSLSEDCPAGEVCNQAASYLQGVCTQECSGNQEGQCPDSSSCVMGHDDEGFCAAPCDGIADPECQANAGLKCSYGVPLGASTGKYICTASGNPPPVASCSGDDDCTSDSICLWDAVNPGYCLKPCGTTGQCAFPTHCVQLNGGLSTRCFKSCNADWDCVDTMKCDFPPDSAKKACIPETSNP